MFTFLPLTQMCLWSTSWRAAGRTETVHDVVETGFEELEEHLAGDAFGARRLFKEVAELTLEHTVCVFSFLLFAKLGAVLGSFLPTVGTMLARRIVLLSQHFVIAKYWLPNLRAILVFGPVYLAILYIHFCKSLHLPLSAAATVERK